MKKVRLSKNEKYSFDSKGEAFKRAKEVRSHIKLGRNFKIRVWNNTGWHYCLYSQGLSVWEHRGSFSSMFNCENDGHGGSPNWFINFHSPSPNKVVETQIDFVSAKAKLVNEQLTTMLKRIQK